MKPVWSEEYLVRSYDVGADGLLKPQAIFQFLQEAAANHAEHLGFGFEALRCQGLFWVLSRIKVEVDALPPWGDTVRLTTWPKGIDRLFALRDFLMLNQAGKILLRGTSCWLLVDIEKMRPRRVETLRREDLLTESEHALRGTPDKITLPPRLDPRYEHRVTASDLDNNNHVNNTEYIRWVTDAISISDGGPAAIRSLQVNFLEEARLGETVLLSSGNENGDPSLHIVEGTNVRTKGPIVQARVELRP